MKDCWRRADVLDSGRRGTIGQTFSSAKTVATIATDKPGATLAEQLLKQSEADAASTPIDAVLDALANYPQNIRIAAHNLGPKVIELAWSEKFAKLFPDETLHAIFQSQLAETRSHVLMGRFQVERFVAKDVDAELARRLCAETRRDYLFFHEESARFVLGLAEEKAGEVTVQADID